MKNYPVQSIAAGIMTTPYGMSVEDYNQTVIDQVFYDNCISIYIDTRGRIYRTFEPVTMKSILAELKGASQ